MNGGAGAGDVLGYSDIETRPEDFYVGGEPTPAGVRITIDHIARRNPDEDSRRRTALWIHECREDQEREVCHREDRQQHDEYFVADPLQLAVRVVARGLRHWNDLLRARPPWRPSSPRMMARHDVGEA